MMPSLPPPSLWLFDMDRTLINLTDVYRSAYPEATRRVYGFEKQLTPAQYAGRSQPQITRMMCEDYGLAPEVIEAGLIQALDIQSQVTMSLLGPDLRSRLFPGVEALLTNMAERGCALGLVTGTVSSIAREVMRRAGLWACFCTSAFGEEGPDRVALLRLAMGRAASTCDFAGTVSTDSGRDAKHAASPNNGRDAKYAAASVVVVGDTPFDVAAGKAIGARTVAVATGHHDLETLRASAPDALLPDFGDLQASLRALRVEGD